MALSIEVRKFLQLAAVQRITVAFEVVTQKNRAMVPLLVGVVFAAFCPPAQAQFDPPRVVKVGTPSDWGNLAPEKLAKRVYYINKGIEFNIHRGEELNVYRTVKPTDRLQPQRVFIGTMTVTLSQNGSSVGEFEPSVTAIEQFLVRYPVPMNGDIVMPRLIINSSVLFDTGAAGFKADVAAEFDKVAEFIRNFSPSKVVIEGHTDNDGGTEYNQQLSEQRAKTVRQYLISGYDFIDAKMVEARGFGEDRPIVQNTNEANKALNRRIEIIAWE